MTLRFSVLFSTVPKLRFTMTKSASALCYSARMYVKHELLCKSILTALLGEKKDGKLRVSFLLTDCCRSIKGKFSSLKMLHCTTGLDIYSKTNWDQNHLCWCPKFDFIFFSCNLKTWRYITNFVQLGPYENVTLSGVFSDGTTSAIPKCHLTVGELDHTTHLQRVG